MAPGYSVGLHSLSPELTPGVATAAAVSTNYCESSASSARTPTGPPYGGIVSSYGQVDQEYVPNNCAAHGPSSTGATRREGSGDLDRSALSSEVVDDAQRAKHAAVSELIGHEIDGPGLIGPRRQRQRHAIVGRDSRRHQTMAIRAARVWFV